VLKAFEAIPVVALLDLGPIFPTFSLRVLDFEFLPYAACFTNIIFSLNSAGVMLPSAECGL
jgi:hypothetical protein